VQGHKQKGRARDVQGSREWGNLVATSLQGSQRFRFVRAGDVGRAMHAVEGVPGQRCHARDVRVYRGHVFRARRAGGVRWVVRGVGAVGKAVSSVWEGGS